MEMFSYLPFELWYHIFMYCDFLSKIRFRQVNKLAYLLEIHDFYYINWKYLDKLTEDILRNYKFIRYLDISNNENIFDISYLTNLEILNAGNECGLDNFSLTKFNLVKLYANNNSKITNVNGMKRLKILHANDNCGIDDKGIENLDLIELSINRNKKIINIEHLKNLKTLNISDNLIFSENNIQNKKLEKLFATNCINVKNVSHLKKLNVLYADGECGIDKNGIKNLKLKIFLKFGNKKFKKEKF